MTILNLHLTPTRALVGMDTRVAHTLTGEEFDASKFGLIPECNVLVAWRGERNVHANIFSQLFCARGSINYDTVVGWLPELVPQAVDAYVKAVSAQFLPPGAELGSSDSRLFRTIEMLVVGWSREKSRMCAVACQMSPDDTEAALTEVDWWLSPKNCLEQSERVAPSSIGAMERIARAQLREIRELGYQDQGFGGSFLLAEVTKDEVRIRRRSIFPAS